MSRTQEILEAVDHLIQVHDDWESDPQTPEVPTQEFEQAVLHAASVCDGDVPAPCRELVDTVSRLHLEWDKYADGQMRPDHRPVGSFWAAFREMLHAREGARPVVPVKPEPVSVLLKQKVPYRQIAYHIYGDGKSGPLVGEDGQPDLGKIHQEADKPGSVIPADWLHPDHIERMERQRSEFERRLKAVSKSAEDFEEDPATIEDLLREGQYPAVVAKVKGVPINDVMEAVKKLQKNGIKVNESPNIGSERSPYEPELTEEQDAALQPKNRDGEQLATAEESDGQAINDLIIEIHEHNPDMDAGSIVSKISDDLGEPVSVQKVAAVLREHRKSATAES